MNSIQNKKINDLLEKQEFKKAKKIFDQLEEENTADYWLLRGKIEQKFQNWGNAVNAFSKVLDLDESNQEARNNIHVIQNILNFWNPEMFNP